MMDEQEEYLKKVAAQLRKPEGEWGLETGRQMNINNRQMNELGIAAMELSANDSVLEIGMGNGFFAKDILEAASGISYIGCDYSPTMVEEAKKQNAAYIQAGKAEFFLPMPVPCPCPEIPLPKHLR
jgi:ubiquinone/menaquinone biosynthesis C-methylase UbiE